MFLYKCWRERSVRGEIRVGEITDPLYLPLKRGGLVCPPLEGPMLSNGSEKNLCPSVRSVGDKIIIRVGEIIYPWGILLVYLSTSFIPLPPSSRVMRCFLYRSPTPFLNVFLLTSKRSYISSASLLSPRLQ